MPVVLPDDEGMEILFKDLSLGEVLCNRRGQHSVDARDLATHVHDGELPARRSSIGI